MDDESDTYVYVMSCVGVPCRSGLMSNLKQVYKNMFVSVLCDR